MLRAELDAWLPKELSPGERSKLLERFADFAMEDIDAAIGWGRDDHDEPLTAISVEGDESTSIESRTKRVTNRQRPMLASSGCWIDCCTEAYSLVTRSRPT